MQLQTARQKEGESLQEFADRCESLAQKTVVQVDESTLQKLHSEQEERNLLASFTSRLVGKPGRYVKYARPENLRFAKQNLFQQSSNFLIPESD
jgi:hypothetical protein